MGVLKQEDVLQPLFALHGSSVLYDGREELARPHLQTVITHSMRRKLWLAGFDGAFWKELRQKREASVTWNFTRHNAKNDKSWVSFQAWTRGAGTYHLYCIGPQAPYAIERINKALLDKTPKWLQKWLAAEERGVEPKSRRLAKKRKRLLEARRRKKEQQEKGRSLKKRHFIPAPISLERNELLTPQFRKSFLFWREALTETTAIFRVKSTWKYTARERVARELWGSLERSGYRFAQFKRDGFCLRFDLVDGLYRGEITPVKVACSKDNRHPTYRRMRECLRDRLQGLSLPEQQVRRDLFYRQDPRFAA